MAHEGTLLPAAQGANLRGRSVSIEYGPSHPSTLFLVFSPRCGACEQDWPTWDRAAKIAACHGLRVVAINIARTPLPLSYQQHRMLGVQLVLNPKAETILDYNLLMAPQTILVGPMGRVRRVWSGVLGRQSVTALLQGITKIAGGEKSARTNLHKGGG